mmetsp:Transcript_13559/g.31510  ORF Transcript_13559/g.31510 Transcript_13559/m.31510 type:complete len:224 (+) Transcript_13559:1127-1798(+)
MVSSHAIDEACKGGKEATKKDVALGSHQLIDHTKVVAVDSLEKMLEIIQKDNVVMLFEWIKEGLVAFVRGNKDGLVRRQLILAVFVDLLGIDAGGLELKVSPSNVKCIKRPAPSSLSRTLPHGRHQPSRCTLNLVRISHVITHESFHPQILSPILKEQKRVKVHQVPDPHLVITHEMHHQFLLHLLVVDAEISAPRTVLMQSVNRWSIHIHGMSEKLISVHSL